MSSSPLVAALTAVCSAAPPPLTCVVAAQEGTADNAVKPMHKHKGLKECWYMFFITCELMLGLSLEDSDTVTTRDRNPPPAATPENRLDLNCLID